MLPSRPRISLFVGIVAAALAVLLAQETTLSLAMPVTGSTPRSAAPASTRRHTTEDRVTLDLVRSFLKQCPQFFVPLIRRRTLSDAHTLPTVCRQLVQQLMGRPIPGDPHNRPYQIEHVSLDKPSLVLSDFAVLVSWKRIRALGGNGLIAFLDWFYPETLPAVHALFFSQRLSVAQAKKIDRPTFGLMFPNLRSLKFSPMLPDAYAIVGKAVRSHLYKIHRLELTVCHPDELVSFMNALIQPNASPLMPHLKILHLHLAKPNSGDCLRANKIWHRSVDVTRGEHCWANIGLAHQLATFPTLRRLSLDHLFWCSADLGFLLRSLPGRGRLLESLSLVGNGFTPNDLETIFYAPRYPKRILFPHLQELLMSENPLGDGGVKFLASRFFSMPKLQVLGLANVNMGHAAFQDLLDGFTSTPKMRFLDISGLPTSAEVEDDISDLQEYIPELKIRWKVQPRVLSNGMSEKDLLSTHVSSDSLGSISSSASSSAPLSSPSQAIQPQSPLTAFTTLGGDVSEEGVGAGGSGEPISGTVHSTHNPNPAMAVPSPPETYFVPLDDLLMPPPPPRIPVPAPEPITGVKRKSRFSLFSIAENPAPNVAVSSSAMGVEHQPLPMDVREIAAQPLSPGPLFLPESVQDVDQDDLLLDTSEVGLSAFGSAMTQILNENGIELNQLEEEIEDLEKIIKRKKMEEETKKEAGKSARVVPLDSPSSKDTAEIVYISPTANLEDTATAVGNFAPPFHQT